MRLVKFYAVASIPAMPHAMLSSGPASSIEHNFLPSSSEIAKHGISEGSGTLYSIAPAAAKCIEKKVFVPVVHSGYV